MEAETADGRVGQVVASPRDGKWLVAREDGRNRRYREEKSASMTVNGISLVNSERINCRIEQDSPHTQRGNRIV